MTRRVVGAQPGSSDATGDIRALELAHNEAIARGDVAAHRQQAGRCRQRPSGVPQLHPRRGMIARLVPASHGSIDARAQQARRGRRVEQQVIDA